MQNLKERMTNLSNEFNELSKVRENYINEISKIENRMVQIQGAVSELKAIVEESDSENIEPADSVKEE